MAASYEISAPIPTQLELLREKFRKHRKNAQLLHEIQGEVEVLIGRVGESISRLEVTIENTKTLGMEVAPFEEKLKELQEQKELIKAFFNELVAHTQKLEEEIKPIETVDEATQTLAEHDRLIQAYAELVEQGKPVAEKETLQIQINAVAAKLFHYFLTGKQFESGRSVADAKPEEANILPFEELSGEQSVADSETVTTPLTENPSSKVLTKEEPAVEEEVENPTPPADEDNFLPLATPQIVPQPGMMEKVRQTGIGRRIFGKGDSLASEAATTAQENSPAETSGKKDEAKPEDSAKEKARAALKNLYDQAVAAFNQLPSNAKENLIASMGENRWGINLAKSVSRYQNILKGDDTYQVKADVASELQEMYVFVTFANSPELYKKLPEASQKAYSQELLKSLTAQIEAVNK